MATLQEPNSGADGTNLLASRQQEADGQLNQMEALRRHILERTQGQVPGQLPPGEPDAYGQAWNEPDAQPSGSMISAGDGAVPQPRPQEIVVGAAEAPAETYEASWAGAMPAGGVASTSASPMQAALGRASEYAEAWGDGPVQRATQAAAAAAPAMPTTTTVDQTRKAQA